jgi:hypothetical protein
MMPTSLLVGKGLRKRWESLEYMQASSSGTIVGAKHESERVYEIKREK